MEEKKARGLGRGLAALLPESPHYYYGEKPSDEFVSLLDIGNVFPNPQQPRRHFDEQKLEELAISIKEFGILQPLIVAEGERGHYIIIAGERRWRAAKKAGLTQLSCIIRSLEQQQLLELSLIENIQREDLQPLEEAFAFRDLLEHYNYTQEALAARLGKSRPYITNTLRLLTLAPKFQEMLNQGLLSAGHARALLSLPDQLQQTHLAGRIIKDNLSVRQAEHLAQQLRAVPAAKPPKEPSPSSAPIYDDIARRLKDKWGVKVAVLDNKGRGKIVIDYYCEDDLQRILDSLLEEEM